MAFGLLVGMIFISVAYGYVRPHSIQELLKIVNGDFQAMPLGKIYDEIPNEIGTWGGNPSEVIQLDDNKRVLNFIEAAHEDNTQTGPMSSCDIFQFIDLNSIKNEPFEGNRILTLSAEFSRDKKNVESKYPKTLPYIQIKLLKATPEQVKSSWPNLTSKIVTYSQKYKKLKAGESALLKTSCIYDSEATVALVILGVNTMQPSLTPAKLSDYSVDHVKLTLNRQPNLPVSFVK